MEIKCKECGGTIEHVLLTVLPPIHKYTCKKCGRIVEERQPIIEDKK